MKLLDKLARKEAYDRIDAIMAEMDELRDGRRKDNRMLDEIKERLMEPRLNHLDTDFDGYESLTTEIYKKEIKMIGLMREWEDILIALRGSLT